METHPHILHLASPRAHLQEGQRGGALPSRGGQLCVTGLLGWGNYAPIDGCFQRVRFTGGTPVPIGFETRENGILVRFDQPIEESAASPGETFAQCWNYHYSAAYGSPELSLRYPGTPGHDPLAIRSLHWLEEGRALFVEIPQLVPANQVHLRLATGLDLFLTLHELGKPFTTFPGYTKITKTHPPRAGQHPSSDSIKAQSVGRRQSRPQDQDRGGVRSPICAERNPRQSRRANQPDLRQS